MSCCSHEVIAYSQAICYPSIGAFNLNKEIAVLDTLYQPPRLTRIDLDLWLVEWWLRHPGDNSVLKVHFTDLRTPLHITNEHH